MEGNDTAQRHDAFRQALMTMIIAAGVNDERTIPGEIR